MVIREGDAAPSHNDTIVSLGSQHCIDLPPWKEVCRDCNNANPHTCGTGLERAAPFVRRDLRRAALAWMEGLDVNGSRVPGWETPELDEATIYFRCGDIMRYAHHSEYGWVKYKVYARELDEGIRSIGIVTVPQNKGTCRKNDCGFLATCDRLARDMKAYLEGTFPEARVTVRNDPNETVLASYGRMVLSKQTFCNPSTFCMLPALATTGQGIVVHSRLFPWVGHAGDAEGSNLKVIKDQFLNMQQVAGKRMKPDAIIKWLRS